MKHIKKFKESNTWRNHEIFDSENDINDMLLELQDDGFIVTQDVIMKASDKPYRIRLLEVVIERKNPRGIIQHSAIRFKEIKEVIFRILGYVSEKEGSIRFFLDGIEIGREDDKFKNEEDFKDFDENSFFRFRMLIEVL